METNTETSKTILIPTDFSEVCENAINHGLELAKSLNFDLCILHVVNKETKSYLKKENLEMEDLEKKLAKLADDYSKKFKVKVTYFLKSGNIFDKISEAAAAVNANLIILGTHGKVGFQRLTGSYALKVISSTNIPTLVVQKRSFRDGYKKIIFPVSVSTQDRQKVYWAIAISQTFEGTIHLIPKYESEKYLKKQIMSVTKQIKNILDKEGVKHVDKVTEEGAGNFAKQVLDYSVINDADLIVIMTTTDNMLPMLDSWDEQLIFNSSQIPVICINPSKVKKTSWH